MAGVLGDPDSVAPERDRSPTYRPYVADPYLTNDQIPTEATTPPRLVDPVVADLVTLIILIL